MRIAICDRCGSKDDVETVIFSPNYVVTVSAMYTVSKPSYTKDLCCECRKNLAHLCYEFVRGKSPASTENAFIQTINGEDQGLNVQIVEIFSNPELILHCVNYDRIIKIV